MATVAKQLNGTYTLVNEKNHIMGRTVQLKYCVGTTLFTVALRLCRVLK